MDSSIANTSFCSSNSQAIRLVSDSFKKAENKLDEIEARVDDTIMRTRGQGKASQAK